MQLFYDPELRAGIHALREAEAQHAARVLRKRSGEVLDLVDGRGGWYQGTILDINKRQCSLAVTELRRETARAPHRTTLLVAPTKSIDRFEWILEKVTEIGVDRIQPVFTEHSERTRLRTDRLERVLESAMKQSLRAWLPELSEPRPFAEALTEVDPQARRFMGYLGQAGVPLLTTLTGAVRSVVAIGPEGGFSPAEAELARAHDFSWVSLGPHRLRTETAAITAVHTLESAHW